MQEKQIIERFGGIIKLEALSSIQDNMFNFLIFEALQPFPGYYDSYSKQKPQFFYLVTKDQIKQEKLLRASQNLAYSFKHSFEAANGKLSIYNEVYNVIRIRKVENYDQINDLAKQFEEHGIEFQKRISKQVKADALIHLCKFFKLEDLGSEIYLDHSEKEFLYFYLPKYLDWEMFEKATKNVKYNWDKSQFDAALGFVFKDSKVKDMVRIYHEKVDIDFMKSLKDLYCKEIERWKG